MLSLWRLDSIVPDSGSAKSDNTGMTYGTDVSATKTVTMSIRIPRWLFEKLKEKKTGNLSKFVRHLLVKNLGSRFSSKEQIESKLNCLGMEMNRLQKYQSTLLKHGTYAKIYYNNVKDRDIVTHGPFKFASARDRHISLTPEENKLLDRTREKREELAKQYARVLAEYLETKGQEKRKENTQEPSKD